MVVALLLALSLPLSGGAGGGAASAPPKGPLKEGAGRVTPVASARLPGPVPVWILTPPSYDREPTRRFPVVYFLHDAQGDESILDRKGVTRALTLAMERGEIPESILVAPRGKGTWFVDSRDGRTPFATFLTDDLLPWVDSNLRTLSRRESRAVLGISMGGYGALRLALERPSLFGACGGLSPAVQQLTWRALQGMPFFLRGSLTRVFGDDELRNDLMKNDIFDMLLSRPELLVAPPRVHLRCGNEDKYRLAPITAFLSRFLSTLGVRSELVLEPGGHDWVYWRESLPGLLRDVSRELTE